MSLIAKLEALNNTDLSKLSARLAALRAEMERDLEIKGETSNRTITTTDLQQASAQAGMSPQQLIEALETAKRMGLI
jgi:predicted RNase H-like nuclease (RuvC/YqgF family)